MSNVNHRIPEISSYTADLKAICKISNKKMLIFGGNEELHNLYSSPNII
jgi:hypothetical protein